MPQFSSLIAPKVCNYLRILTRLSRFPLIHPARWHNSRYSNMSRNPLHIPSLTGVRAFAALWVVALHFRANIGVHEVINFDWLASQGYWGVDFFFVLSGFILTHTYFESLSNASSSKKTAWSSYKLFLVKRFARLYPLHVFSIAIFAGLLFLGAQLGEEFVSSQRCSWGALLPNLLMIHGWGVTDSLSWNYPSWSISAEWFAYLAVFALYVYVLARKSEKVGIRLVVYSWLALCMFTALNGESVDYFTEFALPRIFVEFLAGCVLYRMAKRGFGSALPRWSLPVGVLGILILSQLSSNFEFLLLPLIALILLRLYHGNGIGERIFSNHTTVFLGEISYSIYMLHPLGQIIGDAILKDTSRIYSISDGWLILSAELGLVIGLATIAYYLIEKPSRRLIIGAYIRKQNKSKPSKLGALSSRRSVFK